MPGTTWPLLSGTQRLIKPVLVINHPNPELAEALVGFINWPVTIGPHVRGVHATLVVSHATILVTEITYQDTNTWPCFGVSC